VPNSGALGGTVGGNIFPQTLDLAVDAATTSVKLTVSNGSQQDETYTFKATPLARIDATQDQTLNLKASFQPATLTVKAGESQTTQLIISNLGQVHAGTYRTTVSVLGPDGSERSHSTATCKLSPAVAFVSVNPSIEAGSVKVGAISVIGQFAVEANTNRIQLQVVATGLYLNDDPNSHITPPIPLDQVLGLNVASTSGLQGTGKISWLVNGNAVIGDTPATSTDPFALTAPGTSLTGIRDNLFFTIVWRQDDSSKPAGSYSGRVKVTALVLPDP
jgi:hypothetical protein